MNIWERITLTRWGDKHRRMRKEPNRTKNKKRNAYIPFNNNSEC
jgi:hypothetical protein